MASSPYYNTSSPTANNKNSITRTAKDYGIRDFLLNKNLGVTTGGLYPQIATNINGSPKIGEPAVIVDTNIQNPLGLPLEEWGLYRYENAILPNKFKDDDPNAPSLMIIKDVPTTQNIDFGNVDYPQNGDFTYPRTATDEVDTYGLKGKTEYANYRKKATLFNLYVDSGKQIDISNYIVLRPKGFSQQLPNYVDAYGGLNNGGPIAKNAVDAVGSVITGQGLGLSKGGFVDNFDIRASLAGRVLGGTGLLKDTPLGIIGAQQLALSLANNAAFNTEQYLLGKLNIQDNVLSLIKGADLPGFRPNYKITVPSSNIGQAVDFLTSTVLGFQIPRSYLTNDGSIFSSENNGSENIDRANSMLENTGKGQFDALYNIALTNIFGTSSDGYDSPEVTLFRSGYVPAYKKGDKQITNYSLYAYDNGQGHLINLLKGSIPDINYNREGMTSNSGFKSPDELNLGPNGNFGYKYRKISDVGFTWGTSEDGLTNTLNGEDIISFEYPTTTDYKKSLLSKTQKLFNTAAMKSIVSNKGEMAQISTQLTTTNGGGISKGSAVLSKEHFSVDGFEMNSFENANDVYCRSWTTLNRYEKVKNLIRHKGLKSVSEIVPYRFNYENSTLEENGFPKIAPYSDDEIGNPKHYMFSIENLAWSENHDKLLPVEQGDGDLISGLKGRIMWFPPYNIEFSETSNVSWEKSDFIGRGESIYTYNNTERSGSLSFSIIVDHPSYSNAFRNPNGPDDNYVASFFAGCVDPDNYFYDKLTLSDKSSFVKKQQPAPQTKTAPTEVAPPTFEIYFANDRYDITDITSLGYENGLCNGSPINYGDNTTGQGCGIGLKQGQVTSNTTWDDNTNYGLNSKTYSLNGKNYSGFSDSTLISDLNTYLNEKCPNCVVNIEGYASKQGAKKGPNNTLSDRRAEEVYNYLFNKLHKKTNDEKIKNKLFKKIGKGEITNSDCKETSPVDSDACKRDRKVVVSFNVSNEKPNSNVAEPTPVVNNGNNVNVNDRIRNVLYNELNYFERLTEENKFVFDRFREKIRYFHPAFHSMTPEGLNSRLTFLHQCTRQGPTQENLGANNLSFGRAPVCILRIGDFYNTKVIIDNINIDYEPLIWDLNPEGVGVQPMLANVNISFKYIGGSTLMGPINKLQNALSFNYYANTHVYDPRADYIKKNNAGNYEIVSGQTSLNQYERKEQSIEPIKPIGTTDVTLNLVKANENENSGPSFSADTSQISVARIGEITLSMEEGEDKLVYVALYFKGIDENSTDSTLRIFLEEGLKVRIEKNKLINNSFVTERIIDLAELKQILKGESYGIYLSNKYNETGNHILKVIYDNKVVKKSNFTI